MPYKFEFEVNEEIQLKSVHQFFVSVYLRRARWAFAVALLTFIPVVFFYSEDTQLILILAIVYIAVLLRWFRAYYSFRSQAKQGLAMLNHPRITLEMDDKGFIYTSANSTRQFEWEKVNRLVETQDFLILLNQKLPLVSLPKAPLSEEGLSFIKEKLKIQT